MNAVKVEMAGLTPAVFSDHMVLQQDLEVPVWGRTEPGGTVTVTFMKQTKTAKADDKGKWMVKLDKMKAVSEPQEMTVKDAKETRVFKDVLVGDVWLCSGQSNMEWG
jgi:sialate O-acetylesterase